MYPRTNYEMTEADLKGLLESMKPVPYMMIGGIAPKSQQENANNAWAELGKRMGFDPMTVQPNGKGDRFFSAIPNETEDQRERRLAIEKDAARQRRIEDLKAEIEAKKTELNLLIP